MEDIARNLRPAPRIQAAVDSIMANLTAAAGTYNGVHLRMEADAHFSDLYASMEASCILTLSLTPTLTLTLTLHPKPCTVILLQHEVRVTALSQRPEPNPKT